MVYEQGAGVMKELILKMSKISRMERSGGPSVRVQAACIAVDFLLGVLCNWKVAILGYLILMFCLTFSALQVATLHQRRASPVCFEISRLPALQKQVLCFAVILWNTRWTVLALAVHIAVFRGLSLLLVPVWLIHLCFAILLGFALGKVIPNFHLNLVVVLAYYLFMVLNYTNSSDVCKLEFFHYCTPYIQFVDMGRFHISSLYLIMICLALILLLVWNAQRGKQAKIALLMAALVAVGPMCYEVYGNRQRTIYNEMAVDGQQVWYSSKIPVEDVQYLFQIAMSLKKACEHYGFPIVQGDFRFYKSYCTFGNFYPSPLGWNSEKETFYFNVFSSLMVSEKPECVLSVCERYISRMLNSSGHLESNNEAAYKMRVAVENRIIQYAVQQGWLPINDYTYTPANEFSLFSCYLLENEPERYHEIFEAVNKDELEDDEVWAIIEKSYPEIYQDFKLWSAKENKE